MTKTNILLERNDINMSNSPSDLNSNSHSSSGNTLQEPPVPVSPGGIVIPNWLKQLAKKAGAELFVFAMVAILAWMFTPLKELFSLPDKFEDFSQKTEVALNVLQAESESYFNRIDSIDDRLYDLHGEVSKVSFHPTDGMISKIRHTLTSRNSCISDTLLLTDILVYDDAGKEYGLEDLVTEKLLLHYRDSDEQDVFFYGQLDEKGMWDGHCIVNIYKNQELSLITDAEYNQGKLITYEQVFPDATTGKEVDGVSLQDDIWVVSHRINMGGFSSGETWHYFRNETLQQSFETAEIKAADIISVQDFKDSHQLDVEGYYWGNISDKRFNDKTGNSYLVKFFENGTVKTLYFGNFVNGQFDDKTGNAWMIGKKDVFQEAYAYYKGNFFNGSATGDKSHWKYSISQEFIDKMIEEKHFGCDLKWEIDRV